MRAAMVSVFSTPCSVCTAHLEVAWEKERCCLSTKVHVVTANPSGAAWHDFKRYIAAQTERSAGLTSGLALDVASRSWSVIGGRPPGVAAHNGPRLPVKLALLRKGVGEWRGRAVDEGDNIIALCILACVKDGLLNELKVCLMLCFSS